MVHDGPNNWRDLCKTATQEMDSNKLMLLVSEINRILEEREKRQRYPAQQAPALTGSAA